MRRHAKVVFQDVGRSESRRASTVEIDIKQGYYVGSMLLCIGFRLLLDNDI